MLTSLLIENYAIIDKLEISFEKGFSVITGETGAGKSIMMGALGLVLGQRADAKTIKEGTAKCLIEATFEVGDYNLQAFFEENELDYDNSCIIRREILSNGKSRSFVNDTPINLIQLKEIGIKLIDIHSQHENLMLNDKLFQLEVVDIIAQSQDELAIYQELYTQYKELNKELNELIGLAAKSTVDKEYLQFQFSQLQTANLKIGEKEVLEDELKKLTHTEEIKIELSKLHQLLSDESNGIVLGLKESLNSIRRASKYLTSTEEMEERLNSAYIDLKDLSKEIEVKHNDVEFNPERLDFINQRLDIFYTLEQKHRVSGIEELISIQHEIEDKLKRIDSFDGDISDIQKQLEEISNQLTLAANKLSLKRNAISKEISKHLIEQLSSLGMPKVRFEVLISEKQEFSLNGKDQVEFLFSANEKSPMQAVAQIASGGEISRLMLSLKSLIANTKALPTIVFDEIDTGVSGEIADKMADIMAEMSKGIQVICITHLPQIGSKGTIHYKVFKESSSTKIKRLTDSERITEIAQMLSGSTLTEAAIQNAKTLLSLS